MNSDWVYSTGVVPVPVPPAPFQQPTAHSTVPGFEPLIPARLSSAPTVPSSVPVNPAAFSPALTTGEASVTGDPAG